MIEWLNGSDNTLTKYCSSSDYGKVDNKTTIDLSDDAAHVNWDGSWRMPTKAEQDELREKCTWTWSYLNGVNGYRISSKRNNNYIFLPATGGRSGDSLGDAGSEGSYWSSSLNNTNKSGFACYLGFNSDEVDRYEFFRCIGLPVRAVCP